MIKYIPKFVFSLLIVGIFCLQNINAQWVPVASPPAEFITHHSFGFGLDGKGYLVTGATEDGNFNDSFFQYDPETDEFTQLDDFPGGARGFAIGDVYDGKAYFGFGITPSNTLNNDLWVFDPADQTWTELATCPCAGRFHPALIGAMGTISVGMGGGANGNLNDWWVYDIENNTWAQKTNFPSSTRHHPYQFGIGEYAYAGFGHGNGIFNEWYRYDPINDNWAEMATLPAEGRVAGTQFSHNGKGYALSGEGEDHQAMDDGEFWEYDPVADTWTQMPSHPGTSRWAPASFVVNNEVYLFNGVVYGFGPEDYKSEAFKYNLGSEVSTNDIELNINFEVFPNPATDRLTLSVKEINTTPSTYIITDILGKQQLKVTLDNSSTVDITALTNGVYFITEQGKAGSRKFLVSK